MVCLDGEGRELWRFEPELEDHQVLDFAHTSSDGTITLYCAGNRFTRRDGKIWRIDGETGELLCSRILPAETEELQKLLYVEALDAFLYANQTSGELVLLNASLKETARWGKYQGSSYIRPEQFCGSLLWTQSLWKRKSLFLHELRDGKVSEIALETSAYVIALLPDGRILGVNEKQNMLTVFDQKGTVVSRCSLPGSILRVYAEEDRVCIREQRGPDTGGFIYGGLFDETSTHLWRLDPVQQDPNTK